MFADWPPDQFMEIGTKEYCIKCDSSNRMVFVNSDSGIATARTYFMFKTVTRLPMLSHA